MQDVTYKLRFTALFLGLFLALWLEPIIAEDNVKVWRLDGSLQCGMGKEIPLEAMANELQTAGISVISMKKERVPYMIPAVCGAPTGWANVYEIPFAKRHLLPRDDAGLPKFSYWIFDSKTVEVFKYDGTLQCNMGKEIPLQEMANQLEVAGVKVLSMRKDKDGLMHVSMCGASTGKVNVYEISADALQIAEKLGFALFGLPRKFVDLTVNRLTRDVELTAAPATGGQHPWPIKVPQSGDLLPWPW